MHDLYGGSYRLLENVRKRSAGHQVSFVDLSETDALQSAIRPDTRLVWVETPTNPMLKLVDLEAVARIAQQHRLLAVCDNTFATPYLQRPLEHGFDIVVHSTTKYLNGHSDAIGGAAIVRAGSDLGERIAYLQNAVGGVPGPFDSFLTLRGIKTLALRMERHCSNALALGTSGPHLRCVSRWEGDMEHAGVEGTLHRETARLKDLQHAIILTQHIGLEGVNTLPPGNGG